MSGRVLLVEDDFLVAMAMENDLAEGGFEIAGVANSADTAIALAKKLSPDFIVMDIRLVGARDGVDAALQILAETGIRCIFATAHSDPHTKMRAAPARPLAWLQKPYGREELLSVLQEALRNLRKSSAF